MFLGRKKEGVSIGDILSSNPKIPFKQIFTKSDGESLFEDINSGRNPLLKSSETIALLDERFEDLDLAKWEDQYRFLFYLLDDLIFSDPFLRECLIDKDSDYNFTSVEIDISDVINDFKAGILPKDEYERIRDKWTSDYYILIQAFKEVLILLQQHKILREILIRIINDKSSSSQSNQRNSLSYIRDKMEETYGLKIEVENHENGFREQTGNHGSLFTSQQGLILKFDQIAKESAVEHLHEFAAFLILKKAREDKNYRKIFKDPEEQLSNDKSEYLHIVLLLLDRLAKNPGIVKTFFDI